MSFLKKLLTFNKKEKAEEKPQNPPKFIEEATPAATESSEDLYTEMNEDKEEEHVQQEQEPEFDPYKYMIDDDEEETAAGRKQKTKDPKDKIEEGLKYIYKFYSRQHQKVKKDEFIMADKAFRLEKGEMVIFAKDFDLRITKAIVMKIFNKYTQPNEPMSYEDFKRSIPKLAEEHAKGRLRELEARLVQIKNVLEYPENFKFVKISQAIQNLINEVDTSNSKRNYTNTGGAPKVKKLTIKEVIKAEELEKEQAKTDKIMDEIDKYVINFIKKKENKSFIQNEDDLIQDKFQFELQTLRSKAEKKAEKDKVTSQIKSLEKLEQFPQKPENVKNQINLTQASEESQKLLQSDGFLVDGYEFHPLYSLYERLLQDDIPTMKENITDLKKAIFAFYDYIGIFNQNFQQKTFGFAMPFYTTSKMELAVARFKQLKNQIDV